VQLESEQFWSSLENTDGFCPSVIPFVIDMMNSVNKVTNGFTDGIYSVGNSVGKSWHVIIFFCFVLIFLSLHNFLGIYRGNISIGKIPRKFTNKNIFLLFPFIFIGFLVVDALIPKIRNIESNVL